jgi:predicted RNase H-like nuclease (RuvC/YqgF family)
MSDFDDLEISELEEKADKLEEKVKELEIEIGNLEDERDLMQKDYTELFGPIASLIFTKQGNSPLFKLLYQLSNDYTDVSELGRTLTDFQKDLQ